VSTIPISILKTTFGYTEFRPRQQEIINRVLQRQHTLIVMPTGVGKSLCYQIPALIFDGLTLVISPLISLMQDQVEALRQLGIKAAFLNSSLSPAEFAKTAQAVTDGKLKLLYLAPEGLFTPRIQTLLQNRQIDSIAIDEAHCISEWGHDFRPEYRQLIKLRCAFPNAVCIALTATATPRVQKDILESLDLPKNSTIVTSFDRPNLFLQIMAKNNAAGQVIDFLQQHKEESGIIYCFTRRQVDELSSYLDHIGYSVLPYHAGLNNETRTENQIRFIRDDVQIIVATIAFGMGIDKPNIRFVIHYDLPQNIESYYQQIGRAGRDGLRADCLLLFGYSDLNKIRYIIDKKQNASERRIAAIHLQALVQMAESHVCRRKRLLHYFGQTYEKPNCSMCDNCLAHAPKLQDETVAAQKSLSCVKRTGERFGAGHIIDILRGSENKKLLNLGHQHLSTWGVGRDYAKPQWQYLAGQFVSLGLLTVDPEYGGLKLTEKATDVLFKKKPVMVVDRKQEQQLEIKEDINKASGYDRKLFELLRAERKAIADAQGIPPYVIFPDKTLIEMSVRYPQDGISLRSVFGVGEVKNKRYGHRFLQVIRTYCRQHNIDPGEKSGPAAPRYLGDGPGRHLFIGRAFVEGKSIEELQKMYGVKRDTIIKHLTRYQNEIEHLPVKRLEEAVDAVVDRKKVMQAFERLGCGALKPIFEHLENKIPYTELKLCRLLYQYKQKKKENP
jgi:ATP-dependent DNA helicase RecQ